METPGIQTSGLTLRFGGLTAIAALDLMVPRGKITSIIGPNGAGKTSLFNCISGVLRPQSGTVLLAGRDVRRAWSAKTACACVGVGFMTAVLSGCLALNVNGLWRAAVRRPNNFSDVPFSRGAVVTGLASYWHGELAVERGSIGRWNVVTADGGMLLATAETSRQAKQLRDRYESLRLSRPATLVVIAAGKKWRLRHGDGGATLADEQQEPTFPNRQAAIDRRDLLVSIAEATKARRLWTCVATLASLLLGSLGQLAVWRRTRWTPEVLAAAGVARTFQNLRLFSGMTVLENVLVASEASSAMPRNLSSSVGVRPAASEPERMADARQLLELVGLAAAADRLAGQLAYGDRRRLEIARALAQRPWLLLLDEPAAGMNPTEKTQLMGLIQRICESGITVVLIEHEMSLVIGISDHVVVLANGRKIAEGTPGAVRRDAAVIEAYLGTPKRS